MILKSSMCISKLFSALQNGPFVKAKETSTGNHFIQHKIYIKYQNVHTFKFKLEKAELNLQRDRPTLCCLISHSK